ncbi:uncharacterized protein LOC133176409 [Saccostrea echinata]|uniref:uncharacterized protein LOC133176409 n=1 Tax=Saccostrea echinata TaxID=191078 RepID=UPI002A840F7B|nr:uncharacterized protein LOC133176409 [Saccostrea echinata]
MNIQEDLLTREYQLQNKSDPSVLSEFYLPVLESLVVINSALDTLAQEGDGRNREREQVQQVIEEQVTQSLQIVSFWTECADESVREGSLSQWANTTVFENENKKVSAAVDDIIKKTEQDKSGFLDTLKSSVTVVTQKINLLMDIALESSRKNLIRIELDGRVSESVINCVITCPWGYQERVEKMPSLDTFQTMETNIYWFESDIEGQRKRCCVTLGVGQPITFYVASKAVKHIADTVLQAKVLCDGKWSLSETQCQGEYVMFRSEKVEAFFILGTPKERDFIVNPTGSEYIHRTDRRVRLNIPEGAVKETENFKITVFPVKVEEMKKRKIMFPEQYQFLSVTKGIHVEAKELSKEVEVHLPMEKLDEAEETDNDSLDMEYVYFHINGDKVTQLKNQPIERRGDTIITNVAKFSTYIGARVRRGSVDSISSMEVLISLGFMYHCKLITFLKKVSEEYVQIWCELVKKEDWKSLEKKRLEEHTSLRKLKDSDSKDIFIAERQRLRVDVTGNSFVGPEVPKNSLLITFFPIAEDNHIFPPLRKRGGMHGVAFSSITYSMDSGRKMALHTVTFDPWNLPKTIRKVPELSLRASTQSSNSIQESKPKENVVIKAKPKPSERNLKQSSDTQKDQSNVASSSGSEATRAQVAIPSGQQASPPKKNQDYYLQHFEEFLEDFSIAFVKDKCRENGIDSLEIFLLLGKDDLMNVLGLVLGDSLKCIQAQKKYRELDI